MLVKGCAVTYAAVQAKISILFALVITLRLVENAKVKTHTMANLYPRFCTKYRIRIDTNGVIEATKVPIISIAPSKWESE